MSSNSANKTPPVEPGHRAQRWSTLLVARSDLLLAIWVLGVVGILIVPLPSLLLDVFLAFNIATAMVLLLVGLYIPRALALSSLPSLLLLTTLTRLALNVSSTRLILTEAWAGEVIEAFGNFVVQGNYVVGAVLFLIVTLVQFLVIARGSERVAEVAARFSLDAMPGRQMAIDADLRTGALSLPEAQQQRQELQRESRLYGAMDGAMKFVKGDAIASLVIIGVNIVGGLLIGAFQRGMPLGEAVETYTLLTIGDGLVGQIPALLIATTAGFIITRVDDSRTSSQPTAQRPQTSLGASIARQILIYPRAWILAALFLAVLAVVPGLPLLPFLALSALCALMAWLSRAIAAKHSDPTPELSPSMVIAVRAGIEARLPAAFLALHKNALLTHWEELQRKVGKEMGVRVPQLVLSPHKAQSTTLQESPENHLEILVREVVVYRAPLPDSVEESTVLEPLQNTTYQHLDALVGIQETQQLLDALREIAPADVEAVVPRSLEIPALSAVLRTLLQNGIPIRDLRAILTAITLVPKAKEVRPEALAEQIRPALAHIITAHFTQASLALRAYTVEREIEVTLQDAIRNGDQGRYLSLPPSIRNTLLEAARKLWAKPQEPIMVVTTAEVRPFLQDLLALDFPNLKVLSHREITPTIALEPLGTLQVQTATPTTPSRRIW